MGLRKRLDSAFFSLLAQNGFDRFGVEKLAYARDTHDGRCRLHVDVELHEYINAFRVTLQEVCSDGKRRYELLEEFEGLHFYRFGDRGLDEVLQEALQHMRNYGLPWLLGEPVQTPALDARKAAAQNAHYQDCIREGRRLFKAGDFAGAADSLQRARQIQPLDSISERYLSISLRRRPG